jgi:hypothetical protein
MRFFLQPITAILLAIRAGIRDARLGVAPFLWTVFTDSSVRRELLRDGWKDIGRIFLIAMCLDMAFQLIVFKWIYPLEAILIAIGLAIFPYALVRGPTNRLSKTFLHSRKNKSKSTKNDTTQNRAA